MKNMITDNNRLLEIVVHTNAKENKVEIINASLVVYTTCSPQEGKANKKVIELLAKHFDISKSLVEIISGFTSRHKKVKLHRS